MIKAVVFDLFETLITEWGHEKYTKRKMSEDLGIPAEQFALLWEALHEPQYRGGIGFEESLRLVAEKAGVPVEEARIAAMTKRRKSTKAACFAQLHPQIVPVLQRLRSGGYRLAVLSNCSGEEVEAVRKSSLAPLMDALVLSHETGLCKPETAIYRLAAEKLGVRCGECLFVGDGGSRELYGAAQAGMKPYRALWYLRGAPGPIQPQPEFEALEQPEEVLALLQNGGRGAL